MELLDNQRMDANSRIKWIFFELAVALAKIVKSRGKH
jgi:hypothetical protein